MRLVVLREDNLAFVIELLTDDLLHPDFLFDPDWNRFEEGLQPEGCVGQIRMENSVELYERLFVKRHVVNILDSDISLPQTIRHGLCRKICIMLLAREPLLLRCRHNHPVSHQAGCAIVVKGRDSEDVDLVSAPCSGCQTHRVLELTAYAG